MALHPDHINVFESAHGAIQLPRFRQADAEFVLLHTGRDIRMSARIDIRIGPDRNPCSPLHISRNCMNKLEFRAGLDIEEENSGSQSVANFFGCLADARKDDFFCRATGAQDSK